MQKARKVFIFRVKIPIHAIVYKLYIIPYRIATNLKILVAVFEKQTSTPGFSRKYQLWTKCI